VGSPGIGKTTLALCAAQTFGFEILEINASKSIRSFEDVQALRDACRSPINIQCMLRGDNKRTCVILDEVDGSDPHAQAKIMEWIADPTRAIPIVCTGNEVPTIFRRHQAMIQIYRCFPPRAEQVQSLFPHQDVSNLMKECQHDVRRVFHRLQ
jgi:DNA polymerase III delta prime subunit